MLIKLLLILRSLYIKVLYIFTDQYSRSNIYRKYYGIKIGENVRFTGHPAWGSEPYLIEIGNNVTITQDIIFLTHDGGTGLFRKEYAGINVYGRIKIGSNVFIGSRTIILPGVEVGDNVVIGAGSVITKNISSNSVVAGVPARTIKNIEEYKRDILDKAVFINATSFPARKKEILSKIN